MRRHPNAGKIANPNDLIDVSRLISEYYTLQPDYNEPQQKVIFGTSGHRGSSASRSFNESHILAIAQAIADVRMAFNITGPCFVGKDTHALSEPAIGSVLEVLTANSIEVVIQEQNGFTPTPVISHAILTYNQLHNSLADGIVITPSHNPPEDGGIKYNGPNGGPANTKLTSLIEERANELISNKLRGVYRQSLEKAHSSGYLHQADWIQPYVENLVDVIDMKSLQASGIKLGVDPLGGSGIAYWQRIADFYELNLTLVNETIDPTFRFMHLDYDGVIRMDCSSQYAMAGLLAMRKQFDLSFANDPDYDRHGIVTPQGLMNPNHYLSTAINYLFKHRPLWKYETAIGKTIVSSSMIDRIAADLERKLIEVPVGFKWFVEQLQNGTLGFAGEESAGASFLRKNGTVWSTDKDGIIMCLLAAEMTSVMDKNPLELYKELTTRLGTPSYNRIQAPATYEQKAILMKLSAEQIKDSKLAGDPILQKLTTAPGNGISIGGLKVVTKNGWFAARPSGTENAYKIYCESFVNIEHRERIEQEAIEIVANALRK